MFEKIKSILQEYACVDGSLIRPESNLQADLMLNSLDIVNVIVEFEEEFGIEIDENNIRSLGTVADIEEYIKNKTAPQECELSM